jgi:hypothetical protein
MSAEKIETSLVMAKARVISLRLKTESKINEIPRLELLGALLAARIGSAIKKMLNEVKLRTFYWTDSEVANILEYFEAHGEVTGFRFCINKNYIKTRNFGFMHTNCTDTVLALTRRTYDLGDFTVQLKVTNSVTIFVRKADEYLINNQRKAILTPPVHQVNWLCRIVSDNEPKRNLEAAKESHYADILCTKEGESTPNRLMEDDSIVLTLSHDEEKELEGTAASQPKKQLKVDAIISISRTVQ